MAGEHPSIEQPYVLVVEGRDEVLFFEALLARCGIGGFQVLPANGKDNIRPVLQAVVRSPGFARLVSAVGVVRDADDDGAAAFRSVCGALSAAGLACPSKHCEVVGAEPRVSALIMPDGVEGELETLCMRSVSGDPASPCVDSYFECPRTAGLHPRKPAKAWVQAYLASRPREGMRLGEAAQAGYWPWDTGAFAEVEAFLRELAAP